MGGAGVLVYTMLGGFLAVSLTDVLQGALRHEGQLVQLVDDAAQVAHLLLDVGDLGLCTRPDVGAACSGRRPEREQILRLLEREYVQYGHTTLRIIEKTATYRVFLNTFKYAAITWA